MLSGCAVQNLESYSTEKPNFDLKNYFQGNTTGWGIVQDRSGQVIKRFVVKIVGKFEGKKGILDEQFNWSDGKKDQRIWKLEKTDSNKWIGFADDVIGSASGEIVGNTLRWKYTLKLDLDDGSVNVNFDDWMYLVDDKVLMNNAKFFKFGILLGEVTLTFLKSDES
tara:strand:- start:1911 stop:2408 length:498 start_codon:yes stop_codon:yes gene_type:complete